MRLSTASSFVFFGAQTIERKKKERVRKEVSARFNLISYLCRYASFIFSLLFSSHVQTQNINLTTQNIHNYIGDVIEDRRKKDAKKYEAERERKANEIMINITSTLISLSLRMNDDRKKQTEGREGGENKGKSLPLPLSPSRCYLTKQGHFFLGY